jgi:hypothetical protein
MEERSASQSTFYLDVRNVLSNVSIIRNYVSYATKSSSPVLRCVSNIVRRSTLHYAMGRGLPSSLVSTFDYP